MTKTPTTNFLPACPGVNVPGFNPLFIKRSSGRRFAKVISFNGTIPQGPNSGFFSYTVAYGSQDPVEMVVKLTEGYAIKFNATV